MSATYKHCKQLHCNLTRMGNSGTKCGCNCVECKTAIVKPIMCVICGASAVALFEGKGICGTKCIDVVQKHKDQQVEKIECPHHVGLTGASCICIQVCQCEFHKERRKHGALKHTSKLEKCSQCDKDADVAVGNKLFCAEHLNANTPKMFCYTALSAEAKSAVRKIGNTQFAHSHIYRQHKEKVLPHVDPEIFTTIETITAAATGGLSAAKLHISRKYKAADWMTVLEEYGCLTDSVIEELSKEPASNKCERCDKDGTSLVALGNGVFTRLCQEHYRTRHDDKKCGVCNKTATLKVPGKQAWACSNEHQSVLMDPTRKTESIQGRKCEVCGRDNATFPVEDENGNKHIACSAKCWYEKDDDARKHDHYKEIMETLKKAFNHWQYVQNNRGRFIPETEADVLGDISTRAFRAMRWLKKTLPGAVREVQIKTDAKEVELCKCPPGRKVYRECEGGHWICKNCEKVVLIKTREDTEGATPSTGKKPYKCSNCLWELTKEELVKGKCSCCGVGIDQSRYAG